MAVRTTALPPRDIALGLGQIADRLVTAIGRCTTAANYFDRQLVPGPASDPPSSRRR